MYEWSHMAMTIHEDGSGNVEHDRGMDTIFQMSKRAFRRSERTTEVSLEVVFGLIVGRDRWS